MEPDLTFPYLCRRNGFRRYADVSYAGRKREHALKCVMISRITHAQIEKHGSKYDRHEWTA